MFAESRLCRNPLTVRFVMSGVNDGPGGVGWAGVETPGVCGSLAGGRDDCGVWRRLGKFGGVEDLAGVAGTRTGIGGSWVRLGGGKRIHRTGMFLVGGEQIKLVRVRHFSRNRAGPLCRKNSRLDGTMTAAFIRS